jgi:glycosyltransferase involved in cell wall biosynthesis
MKISIITVCRNAAEDLRFTIDNLKKFKSENLEYIVVDGASQDNTLQILKENEDFVSKFVSEKDSGIYDAMQKGLSMATGDWVNFMNAGDCFDENFSPEEIFDLQTADVGVIYGDYRVRYATFSEVRKAENLKELWTSVRFCHQSAFYKRATAENFPFKKGLITADFEQAWRMYNEGVIFLYLPKTIASFAHTGVSSKTKVRIQNEIRQTITANDKRLSTRLSFFWRGLRVSLTEKLRNLLPTFVFEKLQMLKNRKISTKLHSE